MKLRHLFFACSGVFVMMFSLLLLVVIVFSDEEDGGSGGNLIYGGVSVSQEVLAHKPMLEKYAKEYGIEEYLNVLLAIIQVESGGTLEDVMQSSESLGLPPNSLSTEESIKQGCKYFMQLKYVDTKEEIIAINRKSKHIEPHLHNALEIVCVTSGALELGVGQELYHMEKGDIGFVFPDVIHHYQVLTPGVNKATYLIASPFTIAKFADIMQSMAPEYPIIKAEKVEPEVYRVINAILETEQSDITVAQAYLQIVLARCIGKLNLVEKSSVGSNDLIYQTVSYISANFKKKFSLEEMAKDLGVSKYVLSRLFSKTFHRNFNQYLNDARLNYACHRLENTSDSITNICLDSGFESQRTFNRVFKERYKISPSDYRSTCVKEMLS